MKNDGSGPRKKKSAAPKIALIAAIAGCVIAYLCSPQFKEKIDAVVEMFYLGDMTVMRDFVASYGGYAAAVSFALMILQSIAAPLPAFVLTIANANLFGWWQGAILSWTSAMAGAAICFFISRILGRDAAERLAGRTGLSSIDRYFERHGRNTILICRLLPFVSFDLVSYAAGLTSMGFVPFFVATGIGQLPATIVYSYVGGMLTGGARFLMIGLLCAFSLSVLVVIIRKIYADRHRAE